VRNTNTIDLVFSSGCVVALLQQNWLNRDHVLSVLKLEEGFHMSELKLEEGSEKYYIYIYYMEMRGINLRTFCMLSERSTI
jgi:hypothetical protein